MTALPGKPAANATPDNGSGMEKLLATSPGARLQRARNAAKLSVSEVADALHLSPGVVKALEADDFCSLPNATFVKGYLRSYSRLLGIPGEELVRTYESITGSNKPQPLTPIEAPRTAPKFATPVRFGLLAVVIVIGVWFFWPSADESNSTDSVVNSVASDSETTGDSGAEESMSEPELEQVAIDSAEPVPEEDETVDRESAETTEAPAPQVEPAVPEPEYLPAVPVAEDPPESAAAEAAIKEVASTPEPSFAEVPLQSEPSVDQSAALQGHVSMAFTGDCWVEVRDGNGELIYSNLRRNGETLSVKGVPPLEAKLGNGNVVSLSYNGQPVSFRIPPHNVVRVRLGE